MTDYKSAYFHLFGAITDALNLLQKAQISTEAMLCEDPPDDLPPDTPPGKILSLDRSDKEP